MKIDNIIAEIRPRGKWESVDLGVALVQHSYKQIILAWCLTVVPLMLLILGGAYAWYSMESLHVNASSSGLYSLFYVPLPFLLTWWLKPVFERVPLFVLSRTLFGETPKTGELVLLWIKTFFSGWWLFLVVRRIGLHRSFTMPVFVLEGKKGYQFKQRLRVLDKGLGGAASLTMACSLLFLITQFSLFSLYLMLAANGFSADGLGDGIALVTDALLYDLMDKNTVFPLLIALAFYMGVVSLLTPFYVGAGFALYINERTVIEGWDIELAFKRMSERLATKNRGKSKILFAFFIALFLSLGSLPQASAASTEEENKADVVEIKTAADSSDAVVFQEDDVVRNADSMEVEDIMKDQDFNLEVNEQKVYKDKPKEEKNSSDWSALWEGLAFLFRWLLILGGVALLIYLIVKNKHLFRSGKKIRKSMAKKEATKARSVLGMDITPESLPKDLLQEVRQAWQREDFQLALSLLYRGSLLWMVERQGLPILESDTEQDCVRRLSLIKDAEKSDYFTDLTGLWMSLAYGKQLPPIDAIDHLTQHWPFSMKIEG